MNKPKSVVLSAVASLLAVASAQSQTLYAVGDLSGGITWSQVRDATKTGGVIYAVGGSVANTGSLAGDTGFVWNSSTTTITAIPNLVTNTTGTSFIAASDITPDAAYIASRARNTPTGNSREAVRVTTSGLTATDLGNPAGFMGPHAYGLAISDDGTVVYGVSTNASGFQQATRFAGNGSGATAIAFATGGDVSSFITARAVSGNGNVALGTSDSDGSVGGTGARAFLYNHSGTSVSLIPLISTGTWSQGLAMNAAGTLSLIGGDTSTNANGVLYLSDGTNNTLLGTPNAAWAVNNLGGMSADGSVVAMTWDDSANGRSYLYNTNGWQDFHGVALASGLNLTGWTNFNVFGISEDGTLVWGDGLHNGNTEGFVMEFGAGYLASAVAVPEPSTYAAFAGVAALGLATWHRRRRAQTCA